jgi:mono/diheme cytochrome c family protein
MRIQTRAFAILLAAVLVSCATQPNADTTAAAPPRASLPAQPGARLFRASCAGCHGVNAQGSGPIAPLLTVKVPDLTRIAMRRGGVFPDDEIYRIIDGQADLTAHGPRHMPVWGYEFFGDTDDDETAHRQATEKVERLVAYLRSLQRFE